MTKLSDKRYGPFRVTKKVGKSAYQLQLPQQWKRVHNVFNEYLLTPFKKPSYPSQRDRQPDEPPEIDDDTEYDVEEIIGARLRKRKLEYLVKWQGFEAEHNSWEPADALGNVHDFIRDFYRKNPGAPRPVGDLAEQLNLQRITYLTEFDKPAAQRD